MAVANRRECMRCELLGIPMEPSLQGETLDISETGLAWLSPEPLAPGDVVRIDSPTLFLALDLPPNAITAVVRDLRETVDGRFRIGARLVAPSDATVVALRRAVLRLQRHGTELDSHVIDVLVLPHA